MDGLKVWTEEEAGCGRQPSAVPAHYGTASLSLQYDGAHQATQAGPEQSDHLDALKRRAAIESVKAYLRNAHVRIARGDPAAKHACPITREVNALDWYTRGESIIETRAQWAERIIPIRANEIASLESAA